MSNPNTNNHTEPEFVASPRSEDFDSGSPLAKKLKTARDSISGDMLQNIHHNYEDQSLEYLLNSTEALIAVNDGIFGRVKPFFISETKSNSFLRFKREYCKYVFISNFQLNNFYEMYNARYKNQGYYHNEVEVPEPQLSLLPLSQCNIAAPPFTQFKEFPSPPNVPDKISKILAISKHEATPWFVDYNNLLQNMLIINEQVLKSTIVLLRDHLEEIQVYLGDIEKWVLLEKSANRDFISGLFGPDMVVYDPITKTGGLKFDLDEEKNKEKLTKLKIFLDLYENDVESIVRPKSIIRPTKYSNK